MSYCEKRNFFIMVILRPIWYVMAGDKDAINELWPEAAGRPCSSL